MVGAEGLEGGEEPRGRIRIVERQCAQPVSRLQLLLEKVYHPLLHPIGKVGRHAPAHIDEVENGARHAARTVGLDAGEGPALVEVQNRRGESISLERQLSIVEEGGHETHPLHVERVEGCDRVFVGAHAFEHVLVGAVVGQAGPAAAPEIVAVFQSPLPVARDAYVIGHAGEEPAGIDPVLHSGALAAHCFNAPVRVKVDADHRLHLIAKNGRVEARQERRLEFELPEKQRGHSPLGPTPDVSALERFHVPRIPDALAARADRRTPRGRGHDAAALEQGEDRHGVEPFELAGELG